MSEKEHPYRVCAPTHTHNGRPIMRLGHNSSGQEIMNLYTALHLITVTFMLGLMACGGAPPVPPDADSDGVLDAMDQCPNQAGSSLLAGCPDQDGDNIQDKDDACPTAKGTVAMKGCPDTDGDGFADNTDKCPKEAEDKDKFEDEDGCPDLDNDKDGVADADDACPMERGVAAWKGCSNTALSLYFYPRTARLKPDSKPALETVIEVLQAGEFQQLQIEGHTDTVARANPAMLQRLSEQRANAVKAYLVRYGKLDKEKINAVGLGDSKPVVTNDAIAALATPQEQEEAREKNRRVEFRLTFAPKTIASTEKKDDAKTDTKDNAANAKQAGATEKKDDAAKKDDAKKAAATPAPLSDLAKALVSAHNAVRKSAAAEVKKALGLKELKLADVTWDPELAAYAQEWADRLKVQTACRLQHRPKAGRFAQKYGENLYWSGAQVWSNGKRVAQPIAADVVLDSWAREKAMLDLKAKTCSGDCGHYTQVVWKTSVRIGCAVATCGTKDQVLVCNYDAPGNVAGMNFWDATIPEPTTTPAQPVKPVVKPAAGPGSRIKPTNEKPPGQ